MIGLLFLGMLPKNKHSPALKRQGGRERVSDGDDNATMATGTMRRQGGQQTLRDWGEGCGLARVPEADLRPLLTYPRFPWFGF